MLATGISCTFGSCLGGCDRSNCQLYLSLVCGLELVLCLSEPLLLLLQITMLLLDRSDEGFTTLLCLRESLR